MNFIKEEYFIGNKKMIDNLNKNYTRYLIIIAWLGIIFTLFFLSSFWYHKLTGRILLTALATDPEVVLNSPLDNYVNDSSDPVDVIFNCTAMGTGLNTLSLYITDSDNENFGMYDMEILGETVNVSIDNVSSQVWEGSSQSWNHTCSGDNRLLVVSVGLADSSWNREVQSITYGGQSLIQLAERNRWPVRAEVWYLVNPPTGSNILDVTLEDINMAAVGAVSYNNVNQSDPIDGVVTAGRNTATPGITITSETGDLVQDVIVANTDAGLTVGAGQVERWNYAGSSKSSGGSTELGAGSVSMDWTLGASERSAQIGFNINNALASLQSATWTLSLGNGNYTWNCLATGDLGSDWGDVNHSILINYSVPEDVIAFDSASSGTGTTGPLTWSHTVGDYNNRILIVNTGAESNAGGPAENNCRAVSVTYDGIPLTEAINLSLDDSTADDCAGLWYLLNPPVGTATVSVSYAGTIIDVHGGAISIYHAKQQAPENVSSNSLLGNPPSINTGITTLTDNALIVDTITSGNSGTFSTTEPGQTERFESVGSTSATAGSTRMASTAGLTSMGWTQAANRFAHVLAVFAPISFESYFITDAPPGTEFVLENDTSVDVTTEGQSGIKEILTGLSGIDYAASLWVDFSFNISFSGAVIDTDVVEAKSVLHNTQGISGIINRSLLIPRIDYTQDVYICPDAASLSEVNENCSNVIFMLVGESSNGMTVSTVSYDGKDYYKVSNISGTGGGEVRAVAKASSYVEVSSTINEQDEEIEISAFCYDSDRHLTNADANITIYYPNNSKLVDNQPMSQVDIGIFDYTLSATGIPGLYSIKVRCDIADEYADGMGTIQIPDWVETINEISGTTGGISSSVDEINETVEKVEEIVEDINMTVEELNETLLSEENFGGHNLTELINEIRETKNYLEELLQKQYDFSQEEIFLITDSINSMSRIISAVEGGEIDSEEAREQFKEIQATILDITGRAVGKTESKDAAELILTYVQVMITSIIITLILILAYRLRIFNRSPGN
jgi:hypothetical protein